MDDAKRKKSEAPRAEPPRFEPLDEQARDPILKKLRYPGKTGYHYTRKDDELVLEED